MARVETENKIIVHAEPTGGYWAEVTFMPGCVTQAETLKELEDNLIEAVSAWIETTFEQGLEGEDFEGNNRKEILCHPSQEGMAA